jgi:uncharacterized protein YjbI with pentapeptide repeats
MSQAPSSVVNRHNTAEARILECRLGTDSPRVRDLRGERFIGANLQGLDLSRCDLSGADLSCADLTGTRLVGAKMVGTILHEATIEQCEFFHADLTDADLTGVRGVSAGFAHATLDGATLFEAQLAHASFTECSLVGADLRSANLHAARLCGSDLSEADLRHTRFNETDLTGCRFDGAIADGADFRQSRLAQCRGYTTARWIGVDIREVDFCGAHLLRRHILDENYLYEFRNQSPTNEWVYRLWKVTSDCGRSFQRWGLWVLFIAVVFAAIYTGVDIDYGDHQTMLSPLYFSVVTLTTLGYGDVLPASLAAQILCMIEVVIGYVMLGGALSIFTTKMARRAS